MIVFVDENDNKGSIEKQKRGAIEYRMNECALFSPSVIAFERI